LEAGNYYKEIELKESKRKSVK